MGGARDKTYTKIKILSYVKSIGSTPLIILEPRTVISYTGVIGYYMKPSDPHENTTAKKTITVGLPNGVTMLSTK